MITKTFDAKTLVLVLENGVDAKGNPLFSKKSFGAFSEATTNEQIHEIGSKLAVLFSLPLAKICVDEDSTLAM